MTTITLLDENDVVGPTDFIRPLDYHTNGMSDEVLQFSSYSGAPYNHCRYVPVLDVLGSCWMGRTVGQICKGLNRPYEFARGPLPARLVWDWRKAKNRS